MTAAPDFHILMKPKKWDGWHFIGHGNGTNSSDEIKKEALLKRGGSFSPINLWIAQSVFQWTILVRMLNSEIVKREQIK